MLSAVDGKIRLRKAVEKSEGDWPKEIAGLLVQKGQGTEAFEAKLSVGSTPAVDSQAASGPAVGLRVLFEKLGLAFLGGLILNIMPCVLPVLALKILGFVKQSKEAPARVRTLGLVYGLGVLVSFLILAGSNLYSAKSFSKSSALFSCARSSN